MKRRHFCTILTSAILAPRAAWAGWKCLRPQFGIQQCTAGIKSEIAMVMAKRSEQHQSQWCWAASIEMLFRFYGFNVTQERVVRDAYGDVVNLPAQTPMIVEALNRVWKDGGGRSFRAKAEVLIDSEFGIGENSVPAIIAQELAADHPLMIGTRGHAMVLTAVDYLRDESSGGVIRAALVRDPWPGRGLRPLDPQEWAQMAFVARVRCETETVDEKDRDRGPSKKEAGRPPAKTPATKENEPEWETEIRLDRN